MADGSEPPKLIKPLAVGEAVNCEFCGRWLLKGGVSGFSLNGQVQAGNAVPISITGRSVAFAPTTAVCLKRKCIRAYEAKYKTKLDYKKPDRSMIVSGVFSLSLTAGILIAFLLDLQAVLFFVTGMAMANLVNVLILFYHKKRSKEI